MPRRPPADRPTLHPGTAATTRHRSGRPASIVRGPSKRLAALTLAAAGCLAVTSSQGQDALASHMDPAPTSPPATTPMGTTPFGTTPLPAPIRLAGTAEAIEPEGHGLRAAVVNTETGGAVAVEHLDGRGRRTALTPLAPWGDHGVSGALTPGGAVFVGNEETERGIRVRAAMLDGSVVRKQFISTPGASRFSVLISRVVAGPTGAVGAIILDDGPSGPRPSLVFRRAGAKRFGKPVPIAPVSAAGDQGLVVMGPDGGGMALSMPDNDLSKNLRLKPTILRRISPSGRVGKAMPLRIGTPQGGVAIVRGAGTFLTDGSFAAVFAADDFARTSQLFIRIGRRATAAPKPQRLSTYAERYGSAPVPSIAAGPKGRVAVLASDTEQVGRLFEGQGTRVRPGGTLPTYAGWSGLARAADSRLLAYGKGGAGFFATPARRPAPTAAAVPGSPDLRVGEYPDAQLDAVTPLPDGRLALSWTSDDGQSPYLLLTTPAG